MSEQPVLFEQTPPLSPGQARKPRGLLRSVFEVGGPGVCYFAINNACNARCDFCSFSMDKLPPETWKFVSLEDALKALDILLGNDIRYLILFGGEPTLHPNVVEIAAAAHERGMTVLLISNGAKLRPELIRDLAAAGVSNFIISIDAADIEKHEENRGLPGVCEKIRAANAVIKEVRRSSIASVTMSKLVDFDALPGFLERLGFDCVSFSYPINYLGSSFLGYSESDLISFTADELDALFQKIKQVKKRFRVMNPTASIEDMRRFVRGEEQRFECLGGYRYFHLDWNLDVWRCHYWKEPMCSIWEFDETKRIRDGCTECMIDCYRDSSVMQHVAISMHDAYQALGRRKPGEAVKALTRRSNVGSVGALVEELAGILRYF